ncbi:hypothetical protein VB264_23705 [Arcicella aquatica]|uniref:TonB C-terminal domain-containing protein n=1 Tax=Arcicella aquatica TaxID=217141 RepID=A0ABU5QWW8_9BACT|nr:hypothetical protein [Arcicella aquatica]MEA5260826.1 hypothetical protein [Arcicella aquatica]
MKYPIIVLLLLTTLSVYSQKKTTSSVKKVAKKTKVVKKVKIVEEVEVSAPINPDVDEPQELVFSSSEDEFEPEFGNLDRPVMFNEVHKFGRLDPTIETTKQSLGSFISEALKKSDAKDCPIAGSYTTISISIRKNGKIDHVEPLKTEDFHSKCFLAIRDALMLSTNDKWTPAQKNGENINCFFVFKVEF